MDLYTDQDDTFLVPLTIKNVVTGDSTAIKICPFLLCKNEFWSRIFFPERYGFSKSQSFIFETEEDIKLIKMMLDIIHDIEITTSLVEDIKLTFLLREYGSNKMFS